MKKLFLKLTFGVLITFYMLFGSNVWASSNCEDYNGWWTVSGKKDLENFGLKIEQKDCDEITLTRTWKYYTSKKLDKFKFGKEKLTMKLNGKWACAEGNYTTLECGKAIVDGKGSIRITRSMYNETCLMVSESYFEDINTFRSDTLTTCGSGHQGKGMSRVWRAIDWK